MADYLAQYSDFSNMPQYTLAKQQAAQANQSQLATQQDAMARRFASLGNLDSGAQLKQQQLAQDASDKSLNQANANIDAQQQADIQNRLGTLAGFQQQTNLQQGQQQFTAAQNEAARAQQAQEFGQSQSQQAQEFGQGLQVTKDQMAQAQDQFTKSFGEEVKVDTANIGFAQDMINKQGFLETIGNGIISGGPTGGGIAGQVAGAWGGIVSKGITGVMNL